MEIATSQSLPSIWRSALIGVFLAFAWILLTVILGLGSTQAHADEDDPSDGAGVVSSLLGGATSGLSATVGAATSSAAQVVSTVVSATPASVQQPVKAVTTVVEKVVASAVATDSTGIVSTRVTPVIEVVETVPVLGSLASRLGIDDALVTVSGSADAAVDGVLDAVTDVSAELPTLVTPTVSLVSTSAAASAGASWLGIPVPIAVLSVPATAGATGAVAPASPTSNSTGVLCPSALTSTGPGGAGLGAWALAALLPFAAHRAWVRRAGPEDDLAPPAPVASTDVSPD